MYYLMLYIIFAYAIVVPVTLSRFIYFAMRFRLTFLREWLRAVGYFWVPPLVCAPLAWPLEVVFVCKFKTTLDSEGHLLVAALDIFNMSVSEMIEHNKIR